MENYQHRDYLKMIVTGIIYNRDYLVQYFRREQKKAEEDHVEFSEFIGRTITVVEDLEGELRRLLDQEKKGLEEKKDGTNDHDIDNQIKNLTITEGFKLPMEIITDGKFKVRLGFWDISKIRDAINEAFDFYSFENDFEKNEPVKYFLYESESVEGKKGSDVDKFPNIFRYNAFEVWQSMFESFNVNSSSRTDVKFMFEIMKKEGLIHRTVREVDFLEWINDTYKLEVQKRSYADLKNVKRLAIYRNAKELLIKK